MATIQFNGKTYNSLEEMPAIERQAFEQLSAIFVDKNGNGIPDFMEGDLAQNILAAVASSVHIDGRNDQELSGIPPELRDKVQVAIRKLSELGLVAEGVSMNSRPYSPPTAPEPMAVSRPFVSREYSPVIQEEKAPNLAIWVLFAFGGLACLVMAAAAVFVFIQ
jgi:hypothetical protein